MDALAAWAALLQCCAPVFNRRSFAIFADLIAGWVLAPVGARSLGSSPSLPPRAAGPMTPITASCETAPG